MLAPLRINPSFSIILIKDVTNLLSLNLKVGEYYWIKRSIQNYSTWIQSTTRHYLIGKYEGQKGEEGSLRGHEHEFIVDVTSEGVQKKYLSLDLSEDEINQIIRKIPAGPAPNQELTEEEMITFVRNFIKQNPVSLRENPDMGDEILLKGGYEALYYGAKFERKAGVKNSYYGDIMNPFNNEAKQRML